MFNSAVPKLPLLATFLLAALIAASPVKVRTPSVSLPFAKRISANGGSINLVQQDRARAAALKQRATAVESGNLDRRDSSNINAIAIGPSPYLAQVEVGSPPTTYNLIIDTGSSNTFVGADKPYHVTKTSVNTNQLVELNFGITNFTVNLWLDRVSLSPNLFIPQQPICVLNSPSTVVLEGTDGTLGLGTELTTLDQGNLINEPDEEIPTVTHNLFIEGTIPEEIISISFVPLVGNVTTGEVNFGGIDPSKYIGNISYVSITTTFPSSYFWGFNQSITYGGETILSNAAGITDTGTTLVLVTTEAYAAYQHATDATEDKTTGLLRITQSQYNELKNLNFHIGSETFVLTPNAQIWPRSLNTYISGSRDAIYLVVNSIGTPYGEGYDFMNGQPFLERFYSVYDSMNGQIGFAKTEYTDANTN